MTTRLTPIAIAISSGFLFTASAIGQTVPNGGNGSNTFTQGSPTNLIGGSSYGSPGGQILANQGTNPSAQVNGGNSQSVNNNQVSVTNAVITGGNGGNGLDVATSSGRGYAGGSGGYGGASVFGGISIGGVGGENFFNNDSNANGGNAGDASNNTVNVSNSALTGGVGGSGGSYSLTPTNTIGGAGGHGGGSVFGGISTGGAGGRSERVGGTIAANGGDAGNVSNNTVNVSGSFLTGATGGDGGDITTPELFLMSGIGGSGGNGGGPYLVVSRRAAQGVIARESMQRFTLTAATLGMLAKI